MSSKWQLITLRDASGGEFLGVLTSDGRRVVPEQLEGERSLLALLDAWERWEPTLRELDVDGARAAEGELVAPLRFPRKVICAGANYDEHVRELGLEPVATAPFFFLKPPSSTVIGDGDPVRIPTAAEARVDYEAELAVVIGRRTRNVSAADALDAVAGYAIANDVSARGRLARGEAVVPAMLWDWIASKGHDTFFPMGPGIVPAWLVDDPQDLEITLSVNGETRQAASTATMAVPIAELIAHASTLMTLEPGDVIATGTPAGVAAASGRFLVPGDEITIAIEGLGVLTNPVAADA